MQRRPYSIARKHFLIATLVLLTTLIGCNNRKTKQTDFFLNNFEAGFNESSEIIQGFNSTIYESMKAKSADPALKDDAMRALKRADSVKATIERIRNHFIVYKQKIKGFKGINNDEWERLFAVIKVFNKELIAIDSSFVEISKGNRLRCQRMLTFDSQTFKKNVVTADENYQDVFLSKLCEDILFDENILLNHLHSQIRIMRRCLFKSPIVTVTSSVIAEGDSVEFTAGVGYFDFLEGNKAVINYDTIYPSNNGLMKYTFLPKNGKGKYAVPVKIYYTDMDGYEVMTQTNVSITIK